MSLYETAWCSSNVGRQIYHGFPNSVEIYMYAGIKSGSKPVQYMKCYISNSTSLGHLHNCCIVSLTPMVQKHPSKHIYTPKRGVFRF